MNDQQAAPGWYPVDGGQRYWDGSSWTEQFQPSAAPRVSTSTMRRAAGRFTSHEMDVPEGTIWSAVGKGVGGITTGRYRMDAEYLHFEKGTMKTAAQQVHMSSVYNVDVKQSMTQKARGVYTVLVHRHGGPPVSMEDVPDGPSAQRVITEAFRAAVLVRAHRQIAIDGARHQATNMTRQEIAIEGMSTGGFAPSAPAPGMPMASPMVELPQASPGIPVDAEVIQQPTADPISQLKELGALRDAGILTEEEFSAKKAEILSRM